MIFARVYRYLMIAGAIAAGPLAAQDWATETWRGWRVETSADPMTDERSAELHGTVYPDGYHAIENDRGYGNISYSCASSGHEWGTATFARDIVGNSRPDSVEVRFGSDPVREVGLYQGGLPWAPVSLYDGNEGLAPQFRETALWFREKLFTSETLLVRIDGELLFRIEDLSGFRRGYLRATRWCREGTETIAIP